jgi:phospho-N-acetylmuramoyl-pentapeptide-transferase
LIHWLYKQLMLRIVGAAVVSFLIVVLCGPSLIRFLVRKKIGDRPEFYHADLNELARNKSNTPTMGGLLIVVAIWFSVVLFANLQSMYIRMGLLALVWLGALGGVDDWFKLRRMSGKGAREGLKSWEKLLFQVGLAVLLALFLYRYGARAYTIEGERVVVPAHQFYLPFKSEPIQLATAAYVTIVVLTMVGSSNAVNLTDGMDGLASGCLVIVSGLFLALSYIVGRTDWSAFFRFPYIPGSGEMAIFAGAMLGACLGFLWYNAYPAQVFMGDTGSLPLGGLLGFIAIVTRQEVLLFIGGGVFVLEAVSVILQVGYFKLTKPKGAIEGRRLLRMAPAHHHFHLGGWPEPKVVMRFWILGIIFAALALATLKLR